MIGTAAAILAAAAVGAGGMGIAASNAASAAKKAGQQQAESDAAALALQEKIYNQNREDSAWQRQLGMSAGSALSNAFGLTSGGTSTGVSMAGNNRTSVVGSAGFGGAMSSTGPASKTDGGFAGTSPTEGAQTAVPASQTPQAQGVDWNDYLTRYPDVQAAYDNLPPASKAQFPTAQDYAAFHYQTFGTRPDENRTVTQLPVDPNAPKPGYSDPTAVGGYTSPARMTQAPLDVSGAAYQKSPGFDWQMQQGLAAQDHIASAGGGVMSGQRQKAALRYSQGLAQQDYGDWRNFTAGQYNADRNYNEATYEGDRSRLDSRYDTRNNQLLALTGFGKAATAQSQNAASNFANASSNLMTQQGQAKADATTGAANAWNQGIGNIMTAGSYALGRIGSAGAGSGYTNTGGIPYVNGYNPSWGGG